MSGSQIEVADIFRDFGEIYRRHWPVSEQQRAVMRAIELCRTAALGGHLLRCDTCEAEVHLYNSCGNRHCPKCQTLNKQQWIEARARELLPVPYFHIVFTAPHTLHPLARANQRWFYDALFRTSWETLRVLAADPQHLGAQIGGTGILHTWGSRLIFHPHTHYIVLGAGPSTTGDRWVEADTKFFIHVDVLSDFFKKAFIRTLDQAYKKSLLVLEHDLSHPVCFQDLLDQLTHKKWVVFSKRPFSRPETVLEYLGRYTHRVAISNERILGMEGEDVLFRYKDYKRGGQWHTEQIHATEFIRRFLLHVLPFRFVRIRYFGLLANRYRQHNLEGCRTLLGLAPAESAPDDTAPAEESLLERYRRLTGVDPSLCPKCKRGRLVLRATMPRPCYSALRTRPRRPSMLSSQPPLGPRAPPCCASSP